MSICSASGPLDYCVNKVQISPLMFCITKKNKFSLLTLWTAAVLHLWLGSLPLQFLLHWQSELDKILVKWATQNLLFSIASSALAPALPLPWSICPLLPPYQPWQQDAQWKSVFTNLACKWLRNSHDMQQFKFVDRVAKKHTFWFCETLFDTAPRSDSWSYWTRVRTL